MSKFTPQQFIRQASGMKSQFIENCNKIIMDITREAENHFDSSFENEGFTDNSFEAWAPNAESTIIKKGASKKILEDKGELRKSRDSKIGGTIGHLYSKVWYKAIRKRKNSTFDYASAMNKGFTHGSGGLSKRIPARKYLGSSKELTNNMKTIVKARTWSALTGRYTSR